MTEQLLSEGDNHELPVDDRVGAAAPGGKWSGDPLDGTSALIVLACVAFLIAVILTLVGTLGVPGT